MATQEIRDTALAAPYLPFKTFLSSLDPFSQGVPPKIDRSLWNQSGFVQGLIMNAYRFFHLVDVNSKPTLLFQQLVKSANDERKAKIIMLLEVGYPEVFSHDLATMTPRILDELIEKYNVSGETKKKATTFFLQAAKFAGIPLSSFLTEKIRNTSGARRRRSKLDSTVNTVTTRTESGTSTARTKSIHLSNGGIVTLVVDYDPFSLPKEERDFVYGLIDQLQQYADTHPQDEDEEEEGQ
jgi:hypothetical protein